MVVEWEVKDERYPFPHLNSVPHRVTVFPGKRKRNNLGWKVVLPPKTRQDTVDRTETPLKIGDDPLI